MKLFGTMSVDNNMIPIGGVSVETLKAQYGTPLYISDEQTYRDNVRIFLDGFQFEGLESRVIYGSKAFLTLYNAAICREMGLYMDVVSGGELYAVLEDGFPAERIYFHGNNKLPQELTFAIERGVGTLVVDNQDEVDRIEAICQDLAKKQRVILRIYPKNYVSKFGMNIHDPQLDAFVKRMGQSQWIDFEGFHYHVASQDFELNYFKEWASVMVKFATDISDRLGLTIHELNFGGGFGVYYTDEDTEYLNDYRLFLPEYIQHIHDELEKYDLPINIVSIEPGRAIVNDAVSTLYTVGSVKDQIEGDPYVFIDGGMADNPRPALYNSKYSAYLANKLDEALMNYYKISGRACEADILVDHVQLPHVAVDDLVLIPGTGAYTFSMHSRNNMHECPAVVAVYKGRSRVIVERETYSDLITNQQQFSDWE